MKLLVTGGAGFIGSHIVEKLLADGHEVTVLDNLETGRQENIDPFLKDIEFIKGDIRDAQLCHDVAQGCEGIFHLAALGSVPQSIEDPVKSHAVNVNGTLNLLMAAKNNSVERFVFSSSCALYGDAPEMPKVETHTPRPLSPYALQKLASETYVNLFTSLYGLKTVSLRYFNVFGPRQDPNSQYSAVIPLFVKAFSEGKRPFIYGDGNQTRDFVNVKDVVQANLLAAQADPQACGRSYNIGNAQTTSINDLFFGLRDIIAKTNSSIQNLEPDYQPERVGDIKESYADIGLAREFLRYSPQVELKVGLEEIVAAL